MVVGEEVRGGSRRVHGEGRIEEGAWWWRMRGKRRRWLVTCKYNDYFKLMLLTSMKFALM